MCAQRLLKYSLQGTHACDLRPCSYTSIHAPMLQDVVTTYEILPDQYMHVPSWCRPR